MIKLSAIALLLGLNSPLLAASPAPQLPPIDAGTIWAQINQQNQFPQPPQTTLDTCVFTDFKNNKCYFKCQSGAILVEPAVKPTFIGDEPAGACATHIIRPVQAATQFKAAATDVQTFESYGKYATYQEATAALNWAVSGLKSAKAEVTNQTLVVKGLYDYGFRITFRAKETLRIEPSPSFQHDIDAYEHMFDAAGGIESRGGLVAIQEVRKDGPDSYSYVIGWFGSVNKGITVNIGKEQTFSSYGTYNLESDARAQMDFVVKGLNGLKATKVLDYRVIKNSLISYSFEVKFRSLQTLGVYRHDGVYRTDEEAAEAMVGMAESLAREKKNVVALEVTREGFNKYSFTVAYLSLEINIPLPALSPAAPKGAKACVFNSFANNACNYKCSDGSAYTQPFMTPGPWNNDPVVLCPQIVFPFK